MNWGNTSVTKKSYTPDGIQAYSASGPDGFVAWAEHDSPGVVVSAIGAHCGKSWYAKGSWTPIKNTLWYRSNDPEVETRYLYYVTHDPEIWPRRGAAQPFISKGDAKEIPIQLPNLETQRIIIAVLQTFDDLIENNRRRIEILEEMARLLYREWFVHFRFPGHEDVELVDSDLGPIPGGWSVGPLRSVATVVGGNSATKASYVSDGYVAFSASGPDGRLDTYDVDGHGVVLSAVGARCGRTFRASGQWSSIANTIRFQPINGFYAAWLYLATADPTIWPRRGSAQPFVSINDVRNTRLLVPSDALLEDFEILARPAFDLVQNLMDQNRVLDKARDLLLPRLVSGELDVSELDLGLVAE
ncbi:MAG: restriction endonuclease subunit S [Acidimicrobiia bacterium]|nr:restriction endonuclease subunit S [Acidimicrobiia bacterium]